MLCQVFRRSLRSRWSAIGAAVAISLAVGGLGVGYANTSSGERPIYVPIPPCRLADTRPQFQVGPRTSPLGPNETYLLAGWGSVGSCALPTGTTGLSLNVTATDPTLPTFLTLFPGSASRPNASNLNPAPGQPPTPNAVNVDLDAAGKFNVYNLQGSVHVIIDVVGYFDDHNHDDRYYTEAEVNALLAASPAPWQGIPSGTTVVGPIRWDEESSVVTGDYRLFIPFPAVAPAQPSNANWAADGNPATVDDDAQCTGTEASPTAPPGKVCLYIANTSHTAFMTGEVGPAYLNRGFEIWWNVTGTGDMYVYGAWAYTAP